MSLLKVVMLPALVTVVSLASAEGLAQECVTVKPSGTDDSQAINDALQKNNCVNMVAGTYIVDTCIAFSANGQKLQGAGMDVTTIQASPHYKCDYHAMVTSNAETITVQDLTVDGGKASVGGLGATGMTISRVRARNCKCWGMAIVGNGMIIQDSVIEFNGFGSAADCVVVPGGGIWGTTFNQYTTNNQAIILHNRIQNNTGPGIDMDRVWGGTIAGNEIHGNTGWAAVSLYSGSLWAVSGNNISQPAGGGGYPIRPNHQTCRGGPNGPQSAGIFVCAETDQNNNYASRNLISNNTSSSYYGILLIGPGPEKPAFLNPHLHVLSNNDVHGSNVGCADRFVPGSYSGEGYDYSNIYFNNNCDGNPGSKPVTGW